MAIRRISVKLFFDSSAPVEDAVVNTFHAWIKHREPNELLLDVADYRHVHDGPGILLVGHDIDYSVDHNQGGQGFTLTRKQNTEPLAAALKTDIARCMAQLDKLKQAPGLETIHVHQDRLWVGLVDRLNAPNDQNTREALENALMQALAVLRPNAPASIDLDLSPRDITSAHVRLAQ